MEKDTNSKTIFGTLAKILFGIVAIFAAVNMLYFTRRGFCEIFLAEFVCDFFNRSDVTDMSDTKREEISGDVLESWTPITYDVQEHEVLSYTVRPYIFGVISFSRGQINEERFSNISAQAKQTYPSFEELTKASYVFMIYEITNRCSDISSPPEALGTILVTQQLLTESGHKTSILPLVTQQYELVLDLTRETGVPYSSCVDAFINFVEQVKMGSYERTPSF